MSLREGTALGRFADQLGREITLHVCDLGWEEALYEMYRTYDPSQQAQGIPPLHPLRLREWLRSVLREGINLVGACGSRVVGHAVLMPDRPGSYELAIFVHQDFQGTGVGGRLLQALIGHARERGSEQIWLSVEAWNRRAIRLYRRAGFRKVEGDQWEQIWELRLAAASHQGRP
ncbi:MAG: GNAT family N-acetyltransferase [Armatimonadota bacterium]|nr:GNAT family N-acetyltransferase [Armatimonadota bacterium]MDR7438504.1 GNAT family N-acetyltransferase [Armatimonadota bacterium]MDR7562312.1 GNAT family N-acetyltransferase [Armatimonadota bacterium]MDR7567427.1 GNAT family N-acetyltransferase [Armatimonadota bacterium]MDR7602561.1 GNAT family N-acetyltransferase [Armatimonadota bacterium]